MPKYYNTFYSYHFIAEGLLAFLVLLPITFSYYEMTHYISFAALLIAMSIVFFILENLRLSNLSFLLTTAIVILAYYYLQFPIGLAIFFPIFFLWRYMNIRHYEQEKEDEEALFFRERINKANLYIKIALPAAAVTFVYAREFYAAGYVLLLLIILYAGYLLSHIHQMPRAEKTSANFKVFTYVPSLFIFGGLIGSFVFEPFRESFKKIWILLANGVIYLAGAVVAVIDLLIPKALKDRKADFDGLEGGGVSPEDVTDILEYQGGIDDAILTFFTAIIIIILLMIFIYRLMNKGRAEIFGRQEAETKYIPEQGELDKDKGFFSKLFSRRKKEKRHPVRQLIFNFERDANKYELGRLPFESLTEWFDRLNIDIIVDVYQKVRYGNMDVSEKEVEKLREQIQAVSLAEIKEELKIKEQEVELVNGED